MAADKQGHVIGFVKLVFNAAKSFAVVGAVDKLREHTDTHGPTASQASGCRIRAKAQLLNDSCYQRLLFCADFGSAVQNARDRAGGNTGLLGHHAKC